MGFIRFLLACGVVLCHTSLIFGYSPLSGNLAVQCFYIISGFYMSLILNEKYLGKNSNFLFYSNRALKIYPIYLINLVLLILWSYFVYKRGHLPGTITMYNNYNISFPVLALFMISNVVIIGLDIFFLFGLNKNGSLFFTSDFNQTNPKVYNFAFNSIAWTVGAELLFYVFAPFIVRRKISFILLLLILSLIIRITLFQFGLTDAPWNYMFFPTQVMFFMGGVLSYHFYKYINTLSIKKEFYLLIYAVFLITICFYYQVFAESYLKQTFLFLITILAIPFAFTLTKKSKIDRKLGDLSYPIYISQAFFITLSSIKAFPKPLGKGISVLVLVIIFSIVLDYLITKPLEVFRQNRIKQSI